MTIGAAIFFAVLLASATLAIRWISRNHKWRLVGIATAGLAAVIALHDAAVSRLFVYQDLKDDELAATQPHWSAVQIYAWLAQGEPDAAEGDNPGDRRRHLTGVALAQAMDEAASGLAQQPVQFISPKPCAGSGLAGILAVGIADASSAMLEDLAVRPCWAPGFSVFRQR